MKEDFITRIQRESPELYKRLLNKEVKEVITQFYKRDGLTQEQIAELESSFNVFLECIDALGKIITGYDMNLRNDPTLVTERSTYKPPFKEVEKLDGDARQELVFQSLIQNTREQSAFGSVLKQTAQQAVSNAVAGSVFGCVK